MFVSSTLAGRFHCYDRASDAWTDLTSSAWVPGKEPKVYAKPGLAYHIVRNSYGDPLYGDTTEGQFFLTTVPPSGRIHRWISNTLSASVPPDPNVSFMLPHSPNVRSRGYFGHTWRRNQPGIGTALFEDSVTTSVKAIQHRQVKERGNLRWHVGFSPLVDGSVNVELEDE